MQLSLNPQDLLGLTERRADPRNEKYMIKDMRPGLSHVARGQPALVGTAPPAKTTRRKTRGWRNYFKDNGQQGGTCTSFGTLKAYHCLKLTHRPIPRLDPYQFYTEIQKVDRENGRFYSEGATTVAAMEAARRRGMIGSYTWAYDGETALDALVAIGATANGTTWTWSMFEPNREGIIRFNPNSGEAGGHLWCANGYDSKRDLVRIAQTWGPLRDYDLPWIERSFMLLPGEDYVKLINYYGECAIMYELPDEYFKEAA